MSAPTPLSAAQLRWRCDHRSLPFSTTAEVEPIPGVVGQSLAIDALRYGLECNAADQNVYVRGLAGTGRMTLVRRLITQLELTCPVKQDRCYVHDFTHPERPKLLSFPAGQARRFRARMEEFAEFVAKGLPEAMQADIVKARRESLERRAHAEIEALTAPFREDLRKAELALVAVQVGQVQQNAIFPVVDGEPVSPEDFERLHHEGKIDEARYAAVRKSISESGRRLGEIGAEVGTIQRRTGEAVRSVLEETARSLLEEAVSPIKAQYPAEDVVAYLTSAVEDVLEHGRSGEFDPARVADRYGVNIVVENSTHDQRPVVVENSPSLVNLLGAIERDWDQQNRRPDYLKIRSGSMLRADGGFLILDARDVLSEPGAWKVLVRTLRSGRLEIVPPELGWPFQGALVKPEPIPVQIRVILVGDSDIYYLMDQRDPDFPQLFKVLADFETVINREPDGVQVYAAVLSRFGREEGLPPFENSAVAALAEHGARVAARRGKLTARFGRIADIAREAAYLARKEELTSVSGDHVRQAVVRNKQRANLPSERFFELVNDGTILIQVQGHQVGQVNGLAVIHAGQLTYGFPARITASIGPGTAGVVDIEEQSALSGSIHTKGFQILRGLLRTLLRPEHPLAFSASLAFEQSYGGIDGDSASGAEVCCLLSALTGVPIRQGLALTGAIDQMGHIQAIGGVNEKIEGFFDVCQHRGLTGEQGVVVPHANAGDLMLRTDVVEACETGKFAVYAVSTVHEALELLTGVPAGTLGEDGYGEGTLLQRAVKKARDYWELSLQAPAVRRVEAPPEAS